MAALSSAGLQSADGSEEEPADAAQSEAGCRPRSTSSGGSDLGAEEGELELGGAAADQGKTCADSQGLATSEQSVLDDQVREGQPTPRLARDDEPATAKRSGHTASLQAPGCTVAETSAARFGCMDLASAAPTASLPEDTPALRVCSAGAGKEDKETLTTSEDEDNWMEQCCASLAEQLHASQTAGLEMEEELAGLREAVAAAGAQARVADSRDEGWLEACCANLAEELRAAQADNAFLSDELAAARAAATLPQNPAAMAASSTGRSSAASSGGASPMAWRVGERGREAGGGGAAAEVEALQAALAAAHAGQAELEQELAGVRTEVSTAEAAGYGSELRALREALAEAAARAKAAEADAADTAERADAAEADAAEAREEVLELRDAIAQLEVALRDSEAKREGMREEKVLMEQQLQETTGELMTAERELAALSPAPASLSSFDSSGSSGLVAPGTPPQPGGSDGAGVDEGGALQEGEVAALRAENNAIMQELVAKKLELAELYEAQLKLMHLVRHEEAHALGARTPTAAAHVAVRGDLIKAKARRIW
ncbi:hypothetical protein WJX81_007560 [Elliptochloris bilobata]|uniref:Uncharacterized protein n=1 Tax=Elliptochloris bilobata TaxID=381761 RepID=A0AAW1QZI6_9CHLO